ncbi:MAG: inositol monophosphatase [Bacteroidales bacterium]|nr:inositol monophosphatase [Bacteroidales bacterium]
MQIQNAPSIGEITECARKAGEIAMRYFRKTDIDVANKLNDSDIVTVADKECDAYIRGFIASHFRDHSILTEESGETSGNLEWRWIVDPIDGTTNFFAGLPFWGISIGVEYRGTTVMGVFFMPATGEMFHAVAGEGAWLNGQPIHVSEETEMSRSVISTGFPVDKNVNPDNNLDNLAAIMPKVRDIRRLGSAACEMCYVAAGFLQGYWELNLHEWDINASTLIVRESGGVCTRFRNDRGISVVCANPKLHDTLLALLAREPYRP